MESHNQEEQLNDGAENTSIIRTTTDPAVKKINDQLELVYDQSKKLLIGQQELLELMLICLIADGHILLEGVPGIAKTLSAKVLARNIDSEFSRIQFTPDLMPSDIIGTSIFNIKSAEFTFNKGPIFSNVILIDEINRAPAKTQAALFEVMEEKQITYDGIRYDFDPPFIIIATQNPIEQEGTYRLPEGQLDRFLMKVRMGYPTDDEELQILQRFKGSFKRDEINEIRPVLDATSIAEMQQFAENMFIEDAMLQYIRDIVSETRNHAKIYLGASPRASLAILKASKVTALLSGRDFVIPDDIQYVLPHILNHRLILTPDAEMSGISSTSIIHEIVQSVEVPR